MSDSSLPAPPLTPESQPFFDAARAGRFLLRRCDACAQVHWYPRAICPFCAGSTSWEEASGRGTIHAFSTLQRSSEPYTIAYVALAEGPVMMTNIVDADLSGLAIGAPVAVAFRPAADGTPVPCFAPAVQET